MILFTVFQHISNRFGLKVCVLRKEFEFWCVAREKYFMFTVLGK